MPYVNSVLEEVFLHFDKLKKVIDKHPNAFSFIYTKDTGYTLSIDLDLIENPLLEEDELLE